MGGSNYDLHNLTALPCIPSRHLSEQHIDLKPHTSITQVSPPIHVYRSIISILFQTQKIQQNMLQVPLPLTPNHEILSLLLLLASIQGSLGQKPLPTPEKPTSSIGRDSPT